MKCPNCGSSRFVAEVIPLVHELLWNEKDNLLRVLITERNSFGESFWSNISKVKCKKCDTEIPITEFENVEMEMFGI